MADEFITCKFCKNNKKKKKKCRYCLGTGKLPWLSSLIDPEPKKYKLEVTWTFEMEEDLVALYDKSLFSEISKELEKEILEEINRCPKKK